VKKTFKINPLNTKVTEVQNTAQCYS